MLPHTGGHAVNFSCVWSLQLQNEEEPGETAPVVNDAPPPYSSISAESTGKRAKGNSWLCSGVLSYLLHRSPYLPGGIAASSLRRQQGIRIDPEALLLLVV